MQHLRGRRLLSQRLAQIICALPQFVQQPRVLDRDDGLGRKARDQRDLLLGERANFPAEDDNGADRLALPEYRQARSRILTDDELRALWKACGDYPVFGALLRFILLTATRRAEAGDLRWTEINGREWVIPAARYKTNIDHVIPLSQMAQSILHSIGKQPNDGFVFSASGRNAIGSYSLHKQALDEASGVSDWVIHDLRRTARSLMSRAGVSSNHAERCLGHVIGGVRGVYDRHEYFEEKSRAFEALAAQVQRIIEPQENVVAMRRT